MGSTFQILLALCIVGYAASFECYRCKTCSGDSICNRYPIVPCSEGLTACGIVIAQKWGLYYVAKFCISITDAACADNGGYWKCDYGYHKCTYCCFSGPLCNDKTPYPPKPTKPAPIPGEPGMDGPRGEKGVTGPPGDDGAPGIKGSQGNQGVKGPPGPTGACGSQGNQGEPGPQGTKGPPGTHGNEGVEGPSGEDGPDGPKGPPGEKGDKGAKGIKGPLGCKGVKGDTGLRGAKGITGDSEEGPQGEKGDKGPTGEPGEDIKGNKGYKGYKGDKGPKGYKGNSGEEPPCPCPDIVVVAFTVVAHNVLDADILAVGVKVETVEYDLGISNNVINGVLLPPVGGISGFNNGGNVVGPMLFSAPVDGTYAFYLVSVSTALRSTVVFLVKDTTNVICHTGRAESNSAPYPMGNTHAVVCLTVGQKVHVEVHLPVQSTGGGYGGFYDNSYSGQPSRVTFSGHLVALGLCHKFAW